MATKPFIPKTSDGLIFGLITNSEEKEQETKTSTHSMSQNSSLKIKKKQRKDGSFNTGRWQPDEHQRFIEALLKYGNEWKSVQRHVATRSSTQARSHAQKFFVKINKTKLIELGLDFSNSSLKNINKIACDLTSEQFKTTIEALNLASFERKPSRKTAKSVASGDSLNEYSSTKEEKLLKK